MSRSSLSPIAAAVALLISTGLALAESHPLAVRAADAPATEPAGSTVSADTAAAAASDAAEPSSSSAAEDGPRAGRRNALDRVTISAARKKLEGASTRLPLSARETPQSMSKIGRAHV